MSQSHEGPSPQEGAFDHLSQWAASRSHERSEAVAEQNQLAKEAQAANGKRPWWKFWARG